MDQSDRIDIKKLALATCVPVIIMFVAMVFKPLWRDEYFTMYHGDVTKSLAYLVDLRWGHAVHPPAYHFLLWLWTHVFAHPVAQKFLSLLFLLVGGAVINRLTPADKKRTVWVFMLMSLGSWWVIYFATEIRPYVLNFVLASITVFLTPKLLENKPSKSVWVIWLIAGALLSLTHYFSALWVASLGLVIGLTHLRQGSFFRFAVMGVMSCLSLLPLALWLNYSLPRMNPESMATDASFWADFQTAAHQFLRGLIVKTFGSNPLFTFLGFGGLIAAVRGKEPVYRTLLYAAILTVCIGFTIHLAWVDMVKERAFIVIMPAILFILADHCANIEHKFMKYLPWVTAVMPVLFLGEYLKNKEKLGDLHDLIASYGIVCESSEILAYYRPSKPAEFFKFATNRILNFEQSGFSSQPKIFDLRDATSKVQGDCPVIAAGLLLPKRDQVMIDEAVTLLETLGYDMESVEAHHFGKSRNILWVKKQNTMK